MRSVSAANGGINRRLRRTTPDRESLESHRTASRCPANLTCRWSPAGSNGDESPQFVVTGAARFGAIRSTSARSAWSSSKHPVPVAEFLTLPHGAWPRSLAVQESAFSYFFGPFLPSLNANWGRVQGNYFHIPEECEVAALVMDFCGTGGVARVNGTRGVASRSAHTDGRRDSGCAGEAQAPTENQPMSTPPDRGVSRTAFS